MTPRPTPTRGNLKGTEPRSSPRPGPRRLAPLLTVAAAAFGAACFDPPVQQTVPDDVALRIDSLATHSPDSLARAGDSPLVCRGLRRTAQGAHETDAASDTLTLKTASSTGTYHKIGCGIASVLEDALGKRVLLVTGRGSVENIDDLAAGAIDLAIAQSDMAYAAQEGDRGQFKRSWTDDRSPREKIFPPQKAIRAVMGLHLEQVLVVGRPETGAIDELRSGDLVFVGPNGSGAQENALDVFAALNIYPDWNAALDSLEIDSLTVFLRQGRIRIPDIRRAEAWPALLDTAPDPPQWDFLFRTTYLDSVRVNEIEAHGGHILPMSDDLRRRLVSQHPYYIAAPGDSSVSIRALLLARKDLDNALVTDILEALRTDIGASSSRIRQSHVSVAALVDSTLTEGAAVPFHGGAAAVYCKEQGRACAYTGRYWNMVKWSLVAIVLGTFFLAVAFIAPFRRFVLRQVPSLARPLGPDGFVARWRWVLIFVFAMATVVLGTVAVTIIEVRSGMLRTDSPFANRTFPQNLLWLSVFAASGYENEMFPVTVVGQIVSAGTVVVALTGSILLAGVVTSQDFARRLRMDMTEDLSLLSGHVILCGWNRRGPGVVRTLCDKGSGRRMKLVVVADLPEDPLDAIEHPPGSAFFVQGSPTVRENVETAGLAGAETVLVLADDAAAESDRDARTLMVAAQVEKFVHGLVLAGKRDREIHTVAELVDPRNRDVFASQFINQIHCQQEIDERILSQSVLNPGLTRFMDEVLADDERNEIYEVPAARGAMRSFEGLTFDEALVQGRRLGFLLVAIGTRNGEPEAEPALLVNPRTESERGYRITENDSLLVVAESEEELARTFGVASEWRGALLA